uniref:Mitochondrial calcium uniporter regulator 1 n=1 Tax=Ornithorhynchus anatinus TaxID=9258 RepID=A0A6I8NV60_ORNAN
EVSYGRLVEEPRLEPRSSDPRARALSPKPGRSSITGSRDASRSRPSFLLADLPHRLMGARTVILPPALDCRIVVGRECHCLLLYWFVFFMLSISPVDLSISAGPLQVEIRRKDFTSSGSKKLYFDTHTLVCLLEENGFTTQQAEIIVSALVKIMDANMEVVYKDMVTKMQQEITLQQIMSQIAGVKKDMIILEKSEFSTLRAENEKIKLELQQLKQQVMDEIVKVRSDNKLDFNLEKSRVKELYSLNEKKLLEMRTEVMALHAQQDRALTQTDRKIDTEVAGLKTMLESHKLDNIKYLAGSVFTCLTVALGFYRLWI